MYICRKNAGLTYNILKCNFEVFQLRISIFCYFILPVSPLHIFGKFMVRSIVLKT